MQSLDFKMSTALAEAYRDIFRLSALVTEQANIITANVWHIPPEYGNRTVILDAACALRDAAQQYMQATGGPQVESNSSESQAARA